MASTRLELTSVVYVDPPDGAMGDREAHDVARTGGEDRIDADPARYAA